MIFVLSYIYVINIVTFAMFGYDKHNAVYGKWRIPEFLLLVLSFVGGSLGALIAMWLFRHKTKKRTFTVCVPIFFIFLLIATISFRLYFVD